MRALLGAIVIGGAVLFVFRSMELSVLHVGQFSSPLAEAVDIAYPISNIVLLSLALIVLVRIDGHARLHLVLLTLGFGFYTLTDAVHVAVSPLHNFVPGTPLDVGWIMGYALFTLAALSPHPFETPSPAARSTSLRHTGSSSLVVYIPLLVAALVATVRPSPIDYPVLIISGLGILVISGFGRRGRR